MKMRAILKVAEWWVYISLLGTRPDDRNYTLPQNSMFYKTVPVLLFLRPSLMFLLHLLPSPVHPNRIFFYIFPDFLTIFILLLSNNKKIRIRIRFLHNQSPMTLTRYFSAIKFRTYLLSFNIIKLLEHLMHIMINTIKYSIIV